MAEKGERGRPVGGLIIAAKPFLKPRQLFVSDFCVVIETLFCNIILCYFNPNCDASMFITELVPILVDLDLSKNTLVCGDFNARIDKDCEKATEMGVGRRRRSTSKDKLSMAVIIMSIWVLLFRQSGR